MVYNRLLLIVFLFNLLTVTTIAQKKETVSSYINNYKDISMQHMQKYGIPASIKLAQGILESGFGNSDLAAHANNHFGIKCHGWRYATFYKDDDKKNECFRSYLSPKHSYEDHSEFLSNRSRYASLFDLNPLDYKAWANGLSKAGYATNPRYPQLLIGIIEEHNLYKYDQMVAGDDKMADHSSRITEESKEFTPVDIYDEREVKLNNRIKYVYARQGDTPESIAEDMEMWVWQVKRYNELEDDNVVFEEGDIVYIQRKRRRGEENHHIVKEGETMYDISQLYGIRLNQLYRRNNMENDSIIQRGQKILLRGRVRD